MARPERITAQLGGTHVFVVHPGRRRTLTLPAGRVFSLLALHGDCAGVGVTSARWPLCNARLRAGSSLGISNESIGEPVDVSVTSGVLTVVSRRCSREAFEGGAGCARHLVCDSACWSRAATTAPPTIRSR